MRTIALISPRVRATEGKKAIEPSEDGGVKQSTTAIHCSSSDPFFFLS